MNDMTPRQRFFVSRRQTGEAPKGLLITLGVLVVIGAGVWIWVVKGNDAGKVAGEVRDFQCFFDKEAQVSLTSVEVHQWKEKGDAVFASTNPHDPRHNLPTRVKCPSCSRLSCMEVDDETGEFPDLPRSWIEEMEE